MLLIYSKVIYPVRPSALETLHSGAPMPPGLPAAWPPCRLASLPPDLPAAWSPCRLRKTDVFARTVGKTDVFARTVGKTDVFGFLAPKTASGRACWLSRQPPTGLLAPKTASRRASWRPRRPPDKHPGAKDGSSWRSRRPWVRLLALKTGLLAPRRPLHGVHGALDGPPGAQDGLRTGPGAQAWRSKRAWRPDGLCMELLAL